MKRVFMFVCLALCMAFVFSCGSGGGGGTGYTSSGGTQTTADPTFSPVAGIYTSTQNVTLTCSTKDSSIRYTTDTTTPTSSSTLYTGAIPVSTTTTIKAIAMSPGRTNSSVVTRTYTINLPNQTATPTFTPTPGRYISAQNVTLSCSTPNSSIYYTTDGTTPTASSTHYTASITVSKSMTIKAIATSNLANSGVATGEYTIDNGSATLTWRAVTTDENQVPLSPSASVTEYRIYYGTTSRGGTTTTAPGPYTTMVPVTSVTPDVNGQITYTVNNLTTGITYYFSVTAYNGQESQFSNEGNKQL